MLRVDLLKSGRVIALCAQLLLMALLAGMIVVMLNARGSDAAALHWVSLLAGLQMVPVIILVIALLCKARWAPWFGMAAAMVLLVLQAMTLNVDAGWMAIAPAALWAATGVGLLLEATCAPIRKPPTGAGPLKALLYAGLGVSAALLPIGLVMASLFASSFARGGTAPDEDFASRRVWGERVFGPYLEHIDGWIAEAKIVRNDVGEVLRIAPVDGPNRLHSGFTDGGFAVMNLEVLGTRGKGILYLPYVEIRSTGHLQSIGEDATWTFAGLTQYVEKSGKSYLVAYGLEAIHAELLDLAADGEAGQFLARWEELELAVARSQLEPPGWPNREPKPIEALRDEYRDPLLVHYAAALAKSNRPHESATVYRDSAETILNRARYLLDEEDRDGHAARIAEQLSEANSLLRQSDAQVPGYKNTLRLARERVVLQYLLSNGSRRSGVCSGNDSQDQARVEKCLDMLYTEAVAWAKRSPYLARELGPMLIRVDSSVSNDIYVNQHNVYAVAVYLRLDGAHTSGSLKVRIGENEDRVTPIDLFGDTPRRPDYPLRIRSPNWLADGQERVKLSAKTGEPIRKARSN